MKLENLRVLISGGTSGLGLALHAELERRGAKVVSFARRASGKAFAADISKKEDIYAIAAQAYAALGGIDVLVNNASSLGPTPLPLILDSQCEDAEAVLQTNLLGPFRLIKAIAPGMVTRKSGLIVNISSDAAVNGYPGWSAYAASKAALDQLTRVANAELRDLGVHSVAVDPGDMNTPMHFQAIPGADPQALKDPKLAAGQLADFIATGDFAAERIRL
jgi:NAD(P)-dependent dehydrogenase (short-subunit alcohol dehydrogenase family)